ncbi:putative prenylcysteine [Phaeomoniella chlamydospora]|uniref:Putative prenylcysteine n=1 Tax=Phaeomoniella chlamydospora TaxID=158046 RepID=A0A0G2F327_PHACM|nr:putative prenylcysteine [Phaeomoniella chlamydospora]
MQVPLLLYIALHLLTCAAGDLPQGAQIPFSEKTLQDNFTGDQATRIAIIGAGAAGSSSAYHLRKFANDNGLPINITIYEKSSYIGGRSTTVNVLDDPAYPVELGASIFVRVNELLYNTATEFGLPTDGALSEDDPDAEFALGVWDGTEFAYKQSSGGTGWWDIAKLLWRYGLAPIRTQKLMNSTVSAFLNMYREPLFPWTSLTAATEQAGLLDFTAATGWQSLIKNGIGEKWAREIIQGSTRVNYGQNLVTIHGLETMVCMATDDAMSIRGGNWRIFEGMAKASNAVINLNAAVTSIEASKNEHGQKLYTIESQSTSDVGDSLTMTSSSHYDIVILAAPLQFANISITSSTSTPALKHTPDKVPYVALHVTLLATPHRISPTFFNIPPSKDGSAATSTVPAMVITTLPKSANKSATEIGPDGVGPAGFWSVNHLRSIPPDPYNNLTQPLHVYKIFSPTPINAKFLSSMFNIPYISNPPTPNDKHQDSDPISLLPSSHLPWYHTHLWHSYPYLYPRVTFEELRLDADADAALNHDKQSSSSNDIKGSLWYTSGIESFISTMETSALMGKNIAELIGRGLLVE